MVVRLTRDSRGDVPLAVDSFALARAVKAADLTHRSAPAGSGPRVIPSNPTEMVDEQY